MIQKNIRFDEELARDLEHMAREVDCSYTHIVNTAAKFYRDYYYMQNKSHLINDDIISILKSENKKLEQNINFKTNQLISEVATQLVITNMVISKNLDVKKDDVTAYRLLAQDFLKENNRILRLDEIIND